MATTEAMPDFSTHARQGSFSRFIDPKPRICGALVNVEGLS
jgi:hypothetical protein